MILFYDLGKCWWRINSLWLWWLKYMSSLEYIWYIYLYIFSSSGKSTFKIFCERIYIQKSMHIINVQHHEFSLNTLIQTSLTLRNKYCLHPRIIIHCACFQFLNPSKLPPLWPLLHFIRIESHIHYLILVHSCLCLVLSNIMFVRFIYMSLWANEFLTFVVMLFIWQLI